MIVPASLRPLRMTYTIRYPKNPTASPIEYKPATLLSGGQFAVAGLHGANLYPRLLFIGNFEHPVENK
jgi:hypothetical protein